MHFHFGGARRYAERCGDVVVRHPFVGAHQDRRAIDFGQCLKRSKHIFQLSSGLSLLIRTRQLAVYLFAQLDLTSRDYPLLQEQISGDRKQVRP